MPERDDTLERALAKILSSGVLASAALLILGMAGMLVTGETGYPDPVTDFSRVRPEAYPHTPGAMLAGLKEGRPLALVSIGLLVLILTPVLRVASSAVLFLWRRDTLYAGIAVAVLATLLCGLALGVSR